MTKSNTENSESNHSFLRAARAGNLSKVIDFLETGTDINTCNDIGLSALHLAAKEGHIVIVKELIKREPRIDATTKKGNSALHIASLAGKFEVVKILVENGANVNLQSTNGFTPLYMAAQENHLEVVTFLINNGADQTITTEDGFTPLAVALQQGHERIVALLLENDNRSKQRLPALHIAVKKNDVNAVNLLLNSSEVDVNHQSSSGFTPLHIAAHYGNEKSAQLLIEQKADVNFQAKNNITPLHVAAKWGRSGMVQLLIDSGALVSCRTRDGLTPLHCSARSGHAQLCEKLIDNGADVMSKTRNGLTSLHMAAQGDFEDTARILLLKRANINETTTDFLTPLHVTAHYGNEKVARVLLDRRCDPNARALNGFTPLHIACKKHKIKIVELLLKYGALIEATTETGLTPLHVSAFIGSKEAVNMLLQKGANIEQGTMRGETALHLATRNNQTETVKLLLKAGAIPDAKARENQTPLHVATKIGNLELITLFLQSGSDPNVATRDNYTALHVAAKEGRSEAISLLLDSGAKIEAETKRGFTPLHIAAKYDKVGVASILLQKKANPNATGKNGLTPLHVATHYNHEKVAQLLLDNKADPKCKAKNGYTPLHIAAKKNNQDLAIMLLVSDADSNAESRNGFSPLQLASQEGHTDVVSLLLQHKADVNHKAKNGLTSMHLTAQEDKVTVARILVHAGADITPTTTAEYTPLHTAAHFGQINMAKYLISLMDQNQINQKTQLGFTPLHLAAQQGHLQLVNLLLESRADPNIKNNQGWTAAHIARKQHYLNIFEVLRKVTTEVISWEIEEEETEEIIILEKPENMGEHAVSDSEDEGETGRTSKIDIDNAYESDSLDRKNKHLKLPENVDYRISTSNDDIWKELEYMKSVQGKRGAATVSSQSVDSRDVEVYESMDVVEVVEDLDRSISPPSRKDKSSVEIRGVPTRISSLDFDSTMIGDSEFRSDTSITSNMFRNFVEELSIAPIEVSQELISSDIRLSLSSEVDFTAMPPSPCVMKNHISGSQGRSEASGDESFLENMNSRDLNCHKLTEIQPERIESVNFATEEAYNKSDWDFEPENVPIVRKPVSSGFLVSFMVDARGGCMQAQRFTNLRFYVPPSSALGPTRLVCRLIKPSKMNSPPALNDGDGFACRIMEMGPCNTQFNSPILIEVPHYASLRDREREIIILRSENGETWKEHPIEATDQAIQNSVGLSFERLMTNEEVRANRIQRILTSDLPQYFALISRIRQEVALIGPEGVVMSSSVVPQVQAVFPEGALMKKTRVGIQAHEIPVEIVTRLLGNRVACSPIISIEPRRRKFHKPITLTVPLPKTVNKGMINDPNSGTSSLRLLCSITGGSAPAVWEDISGSTPLSFHKDCVSFTTTVSARLWLIDCPNVQGVAEMATNVYRESTVVPYMGQFVVYGRRHDREEAQFRILGLTDDSVDKTLECQENFQLIASGPLVEVLHNRPHWIETAGNLVPVTKTGDQLSMTIEALNENRISFLVRVKDIQQEPKGKLAILLHQRNQGMGAGNALGTSAVQKPITTLEICLPSEIHPVSDTLRRKKMKTGEFIKTTICTDKIAKSELDLRAVADQIGGDWEKLAAALGISDSEDLHNIRNNSSDEYSAYALLILWRSKRGDLACGNELEKALRDIGREDVVKNCMINISFVTDEDEKSQALKDIAKHEDNNYLNTDKTGSVDESMVVEVGDDSASQRENDIQASDYTEDGDDSLIVPTIKPGTVIRTDEDKEGFSQKKLEAFVNLINQFDEILPKPEIMQETYDESSVEESDIIPDLVSKPDIVVLDESSLPDLLDHSPEEENITSHRMRDTYAEFKPDQPNSPPPTPNDDHIQCDFEKKSNENESLPLDFSESFNQNPCCYTVTSSALEIDPDDLFSSKRQNVDESVTSFKTLLLNEQYAHEKLDSPSNPTCEILYEALGSDHASAPNDSDQELEEDYSHQIECLKEEMLTEFPVKIPGILPLLNNSRHNSSMPTALSCEILESPDHEEVNHAHKDSLCLQDNVESGKVENTSNGRLEESNIDKLVSELIDGVMKYANIEVKSDIMVESIIESAKYTEIIVIVAEDLVENVINGSVNYITEQNKYNHDTFDDDLSPVLEPESPLIDDCDYFINYDFGTRITKEPPTLSLSIQAEDPNVGLILTTNGDDLDVAPLSPIIECTESFDKSPEILSDLKLDSENADKSRKKQKFCHFDDSNSSSSLKEFERIEDDLLDEKSQFTFLAKSPSTDEISPVKETALIDELPDFSEAHSMTSNASSQQCSVVYASQRAESLQQIDSDSAAGLAIDLLTSSSRTTSMSSSIMLMSCHSTDSTTLTTTTGSTLVRVSQPFDDLTSLSEQFSTGCMSSGSDDQ